MFVRIAVWDPLPYFCKGLLPSLNAVGFDCGVPADLSCARDGGTKILVMTLAAPDDWQLLLALKPARSDLVVIAFLADPNLTSYVLAANARAVNAIPRRTCTEPGAACVRSRSGWQEPAAGRCGESHNPHCSKRGSTKHKPIRTRNRLASAVSPSSSVVNLAEHAGYSERMISGTCALYT
jgi:hypothetical protein